MAYVLTKLSDPDLVSRALFTFPLKQRRIPIISVILPIKKEKHTGELLSSIIFILICYCHSSKIGKETTSSPGSLELSENFVWACNKCKKSFFQEISKSLEK